MHDKFMWKNMPRLISKEVIKAATSFCDIGPIILLKSLKNEVVKELIGATFDIRALATKTITNLSVNYALIMIGIKIYFTNRDNLLLITAIYVAHDMVMNGKDYDLCELLLQKYLRNIKKI